jgi:hypothetical protein
MARPNLNYLLFLKNKSTIPITTQFIFSNNNSTKCRGGTLIFIRKRRRHDMIINFSSSSAITLGWRIIISSLLFVVCWDQTMKQLNKRTIHRKKKIVPTSASSLPKHSIDKSWTGGRKVGARCHCTRGGHKARGSACARRGLARARLGSKDEQAKPKPSDQGSRLDKPARRSSQAGSKARW